MIADAAATDGATPVKLDPETLAIRGRPKRAIRFKRGVIVAVAASSAAMLVTVAWIALAPVSFRRVAETNMRGSESAALGANEALARLPANYGEVPKLGPPLPGDLGRPILERQRALADQDGTEIDAARTRDQAAAAERERERAAIRAAREAPLLFGTQISVGAGPPSGSPDPTETVTAGQSNDARGAPAAADPNGQDRKARFVSALDPRGPVNPHALTPPVSPHVLSAGSVIAANLITGLRSDLPGLVTAQVSERVYDSATGRTLLIPQGARLIGSYDSVVAFGQRRALVVWQRLILPDGRSLAIDNVPATDPAGFAGLADKVDFHTWSLLKGIALSTLLGVGAELVYSSDSDLVEAIRASTQSNVARAGDQITSRNLDVQPTITVRPGASVRLVVHKDLILAPWPE